MASRHFSEKTGDQCEMDGNFSPPLIVGNRVGLHAYEVSKALDTEARLVQLPKKIVVGHGAIESLFNEIKTHKNMSVNQEADRIRIGQRHELP